MVAYSTTSSTVGGGRKIHVTWDPGLELFNSSSCHMYIDVSAMCACDLREILLSWPGQSIKIHGVS